MFINPAKQELENRISNLFNALNNSSGKSFDTALIINNINKYYLTGTIQDGLLILRKDGSVMYFVRKSYDRAILESPLDCIYKISSYKDILEYLPQNLGSTFIETDIMPLAALGRFKKYFTLNEIHPLENIILSVRAIKSNYELELMEESGKQHQYLMETIIPQILREGMSETDFNAELYCRMVKLGYHGVSRFSMFQMEMNVGQIGFGDTSIYPTNFDGPGGMLGLCPAVPIIGNRDRYLKKGHIVFADIGYGLYGYHTDKTQVYSFGAKPDSDVEKVHNACIDVINKTSGLLRVNNIPSEIYKEIMANLPEALSHHFMGYNESVKFLGHGIGLNIDETPVIAKGFNLPLKENMVIALEPKCGIKGVGTVGAEETYLIKADGVKCLTGGAREIIVV